MAVFLLLGTKPLSRLHTTFTHFKKSSLSLFLFMKSKSFAKLLSDTVRQKQVTRVQTSTVHVCTASKAFGFVFSYFAENTGQVTCRLHFVESDTHTYSLYDGLSWFHTLIATQHAIV